MSTLVLQAFWKLIQFDRYLAKQNFAALWERVSRCPIAKARPALTVEDVCAAVDLACIWYWKEVLCLQRSAATACILRQSGVRAEMVIGAQQMPFRAHAWVEVDGRVVNDKTYTSDIYAVLDRC